MIRLIFAGILTVAALVGLSLRMARDSDRLPAAAERLTAEVRTLDLSEAVSSVLPAAASAPPRVDGPLRSAAPERETRIAAAPAAPAAEPTAADLAVPEDVVEEVVPPRDRFLEDPLTNDGDSGSGGNQEMEPADPTAPTMVATAVDQDAWAHLIRRMLSVYRKTGGPR